MTTRTAQAQDVDALVRVYARSVVASNDYGRALDESRERRRMSPRIAGYIRGTYHPGFALQDRTLLLAEDGGAVLGFAAGHRSNRLGCNAELQWIFVDPDRQRKGVGTALLRSLASWFVDAQCTRVIIDAPPGNDSRAFYLRHGAVALDGYWLYWPDISRTVGSDAPH